MEKVERAAEASQGTLRFHKISQELSFRGHLESPDMTHFTPIVVVDYYF